MRLSSDQSHERKIADRVGSAGGVGSQMSQTIAPGLTLGLIFKAALSLVPIALLLPHLPSKIPNLGFLFMLLKKATQPMRIAPLQVYGLYVLSVLSIPPSIYFYLSLVLFPQLFKIITMFISHISLPLSSWSQ